MVCVSNLTINRDPNVKLATTIPPANNALVYPVTLTENGGISVMNVSLTGERRAERERSRPWTFGQRKLPGKICRPPPGRRARATHPRRSRVQGTWGPAL